MFMSGGDYNLLVENRTKRRELSKRYNELSAQIIELSSQLHSLRNDPEIDLSTATSPLANQISKLEDEQYRLERDLAVLDHDYKATLRLIFGAHFKKVRHSYIDGAFHIYYQGLGEGNGDGIGHGHAILYPNGHVEQVREAFATGTPLSEHSKLRTKQKRRGKHHSASRKNPRFIYSSQN